MGKTKRTLPSLARTEPSTNWQRRLEPWLYGRGRGVTLGYRPLPPLTWTRIGSAGYAELAPPLPILTSAYERLVPLGATSG